MKLLRISILSIFLVIPSMEVRAATMYEPSVLEGIDLLEAPRINEKGEVVGLWPPGQLQDV